MRSKKLQQILSALIVVSLFVDLALIAVPTPANAAPVLIVITSTSQTTWKVPMDWNSSNNRIEVIAAGGGGGGSAAGGDLAAGGGGGAYARISNASFMPGEVVGIAVGAGGTAGSAAGGNGGDGGDTYVCSSTSGCASLAGVSVVIGAEGGAQGAGCNGCAGAALGGAGGLSGSSIGDQAYSGASGGNSNLGVGGGAGGPNGVGVTSQDETPLGGNRGDVGLGGMGGFDSGTASPVGQNGAEIRGVVGSGGGGGINSTGTTANGGLFGGGGGGGSGAARVGGTGGQGVIIITYVPSNDQSYAVECITSGTSYGVPSDWNSANNYVEVIGAGGGSRTGVSGTRGGGGGGGGAYAKKTNISLTPSGSATIQVGTAGTKGTSPTAGGDTFFNRTSGGATTCTAGVMSVCAKGGSGAAAGAVTGGAGGVTATSIGDVSYAGGRGGDGDAGFVLGGGGGGGAAGPYGEGGKGGLSDSNNNFSGGGGGGGGGGGTIATSTAGYPAGIGGANYAGYGAGTPEGVEPAVAPADGGGGYGGTSEQTAFAGSAGAERTQSISPAGAVCGSGGGGGGGGNSATSIDVGANAGNYGAAGGGGSGNTASRAAGNSAGGVIMVSYSQVGTTTGRTVRLLGVRLLGGVRLGGGIEPLGGYPEPASLTETVFASNATNHNVTMPPVVNANDLLLVLFTNDGSATVTDPDGAGGWTEVATLPRSTLARGTVYAKVADGTEDGTTVNFVTSASEQAAAQVFRFFANNWYGTIIGGIATSTSDPGGTTAAPNPPSLNPANWDIEKTLWMAYAAASSYDIVLTFPSGYTNTQHTLSDSTTAGASVSSAILESYAASEDPGAFSMNSAQSATVFTIGIRPARP